MKAQELASLVEGTLYGDGSIEVTGVASVDEASAGDAVLAENEKYLKTALESQAVVIVCKSAEGIEKTAIVVDDPRLAFAKIIACFAPKIKAEQGIHPGCYVGSGLKLGEGVSIGYGCYIGDNVEIGDGAVVAPQCYVGDGVKIGAGSRLLPRVTVQWGSEIGRNVIIQSGSVIGADGFGYVTAGGVHHKIPHIGNVVIEDDVEIGANVTVDRGKTGATVIGQGTKVDNLVMIAHNVKIGRNCLIVAQAGIAGSVEMGNYVVVAGQAGARDHAKIGDGAIIAARAGVISDVSAGACVSGFPARDRAAYWRIEACLDKLPEIVKSVRKLNTKSKTEEQG